MRAALGNFNNITNAGLVVLIVNAKFRSTFDIFTVFWMPDLKVDGNFDAFGTTVAHYHAGYSF
jgi:hypothetical protein